MSTGRNTRYLGQPHYTGPSGGWALLGHHDILLEWWPIYQERVQEIRTTKPAREHKERFRHFVVVTAEEVPWAVLSTWEAWETAAEAWEIARHEAQPTLEALLAKYVPDHRWNGREIVFPSEV